MTSIAQDGAIILLSKKFDSLEEEQDEDIDKAWGGRVIKDKY